jgi:hypothetical protein
MARFSERSTAVGRPSSPPGSARGDAPRDAREAPEQHARSAPPEAGVGSTPRFYSAEQATSPRQPEPRRARPWVAALAAAAVGLLALLTFVLATSLAVRAAVPLVGALAALAWLVPRRARPAPTSEPVRRGLELAGDALAFRPRGADKVPVLSVAEPFGVTLLATHARDRLVALVSSTRGTLYVGVRQVEREVLGALFEHATTVAADDAALDAVGPDGEPLLLEPSELARLVSDLASVAPQTLDRLIVGVGGETSLSLEPHELRVALGGRDPQVFDLESPLEWRAIVFQEPIGPGVAVFQGTWVRQGAREVVLVAPLTLGGPFIDPSAGPIERSVQRDLRLMQAQPEDPPPRDKRVAIDRPLMLPLRSALDRAPRISVVPKRSATLS